MDGNLILLTILVACVLGVLFVLILMRMAGDQDRIARRAEKELASFSDVTTTRLGRMSSRATSFQAERRATPPSGTSSRRGYSEWES